MDLSRCWNARPPRGVRDPVSGVNVLVGESTDGLSRSETWHFDFLAPSWMLVLLGCAPRAGEFASTWLYRPLPGTWTLLEAGASPPDVPLDHGQLASDGQHLYLLGGFNPGSATGGPGVFPRGSMWKY